MYSSLYVPCASGAQVTSWVAFSRFLLESAFAVRLPPLLPELLRMQWAPGLHRGARVATSAFGKRPMDQPKMEVAC